MPARKAPATQEQPAAETVPVVEPTEEEEQLAADSIGSQWEFIERVPTLDEVRELLMKLPPVWGVAPVMFLDYVQALPSTKKTKQTQERDGRKFKVDVYVDIWTVYFSVAGRIQMLRTAQELHGWKVDFVPEPNPFPGNPPGFLEPMSGDRLVYREYVEIHAPIGSRLTFADGTPSEGTMSVPDWRCLGRRPGTAWVPRKGGKQAAGSNPYEKVETSARGRALSAWGFGVLPGSGIASVEEMAGVPQNRAGMDSEPDPGQEQTDGEPEDRSRKGMISDILTICEEITQLSGQESGEKLKRIADYARKHFGVEMVTAASPETGLPEELDWARVKDGQLQLLRNVVRKKLAYVRANPGEGPDGEKPASTS